jgi:hypothetical protein
MDKFLESLKYQAEQNPLLTLVVAAALFRNGARFVDAAGRAKGSYAYARDVDRRVRQSQSK